jgi:hypothetical protein
MTLNKNKKVQEEALCKLWPIHKTTHDEIMTREWLRLTVGASQMAT